MPLPMVDLLGEPFPATAVIDLCGESPVVEAGAKRRRLAAGPAAASSSSSRSSSSSSALAHLECPICLQPYSEPPPQPVKGGAGAAAAFAAASAAAAAAKGAAAGVVATLCGHHAHAVCATAWLAKCPAGKLTCFKCAQQLAQPFIHPLFLV